MEFGMPLIESVIGVTVLVATVSWITYLTMKPRSRSAQEPARAYVPHQPWDNDKQGGRGNR